MDSSVSEIPTVNVLGTRIAALDMTRATRHISAWIEEEGFGRYICVTGAHGVVEGTRDPQVMRIHNEADLCVPDGMPLVWLGRYYGHRKMSRVYGPDLMMELLAIAERRGYTSFLYGGKPGVAERLRDRLLEKFPSLVICGVHAPPFRELTQDEEEAITKEINLQSPDFLWIGLSTPKQEKRMAAWQGRIRAKVMLGVGAAFDFHAGLIRQAPRWMMKSGLEWLYRLVREPRRLWRRYLLGNPLFVCRVCAQLVFEARQKSRKRLRHDE